MKHLAILFCFEIVFQFAVSAQVTPGVEWERCISNSTVRSAVNLSDSVFTIAIDLKSCGDSSSVGLRSYDGEGNLLWEKIFSPPAAESYQVFSLSKTLDHGYIFAGRKDSSSSDFNWLVKTDSTGDVQWEKQFFFSDSETISFGKVIQTPNGNYLLITDQYSPSSLRDLFAVALDINGNLLWQKSFDGSLFDYARDVVATDDGGFLIAAYSSSNDGDFTGNSGFNDIWLFKIDSNGNIQLKKRYGGMFNDEVCSVLKLTDGYLVGGVSESSDGSVTQHNGSNTYYDVWVFKVDANGNIVWQKSFGGKNDDYASQMIALSDGNFILTGSSYSTDGNVNDHHVNSNFDDQWTIKISPTGNLLWKKSTGGSGDDWSNCAIALDSDEVIIAGASFSTDGDHHTTCFSNDCRPIEGGWIVKLNEHCPSYPTSQFSFSQNGKDFAFTNESYNANTYLWNFGDGSTSTDINPSHTYLINGEYNICLTASDTCSSKTFCTTVSTCTSAAVASFNFSYPGGTTVEFIDLSANATKWSWDFGDGSSDSTQNPTHSYTLNGTYSVTLTVYDSCNNSNSITQAVNTCNGFNADFGFTINANTVSFSDSTEGLPSSWNWNFGDGDSSQLQNPFHAYMSQATYVVCLTAAANECPPQTICKAVSVCNPVLIDSFTYTVVLDSASFFDASQNDTAWQWNFGDGNFSSEENPQHGYAQPGIYTVCEKILNSCNADSICQVVNVECLQVQTSFVFTSNNLDISFVDESLNATIWQWNFGDGNFSSDQNPTYTYSAAGTYHACLIASNNCTTDTSCEDVIAQCPPLVAAFTFVQTSDTVLFTDQSANAIQWQWDFGDGNFSSQQNPSHTYSQAGTYQVCLIASDNCSSDTFCQDVIIQCPPFVAGFTFLQSSDTVLFIDESANATQWQWDFGDGNFSSQQNPLHVYSQAGTYNACLIASDSCSSDTVCEDVSVQCPAFVAAFTFVQSNDTVWFTDESANAIQWQWDFGDGNSSSQQNPFHIYDTTGTFFVCLMSYDGCSFDTLCDTVQVIPLNISSSNPENFSFSIVPNPFHEDALITFFIAQPSFVSIMLYDVSGKEAMKIFDGEVSEGTHSTVIHSQNLPAGTYFVKLKSEREFVVGKLIVE